MLKIHLNIFNKLSCVLMFAVIFYSSHAQHTPSDDRNFIYTRTILKNNVKTQADISALTANDVRAEVQYFDGLGRPLQNVGVKVAPDGKDIVTPITYDAFGRQDKNYLPYAATGTNGAYRSTALTEQASFYAAPPTTSIPAIPNPYNQTVFEASPLNRPLETGAPGQPWAIGNGHTIKTGYEINGANEVRLWNVMGQGQSTEGGSGAVQANPTYNNHTPGTTEYKATNSITFTNGFESGPNASFTAHIVSGSGGNPAMGASSPGYYAPGQLYKKVTWDEHRNRVIEYKDKEGQVVCKKVQDGGDTLNAPTYMVTQYIYDDFSQLAYVLPPALESIASFTEADANFEKYIYAYHYDGRRRLIEKKIPGKGWEYIVYNAADRPIFTSDGEQRSRGVWSFIKYDGLGRVIMTGEVTNASGRAALQATVNSTLKPAGSTELFESYNGNTGSSNMGYTNTTLPNTNFKIFTVNYYDNYNILGTVLNPDPTHFIIPGISTPESQRTKSLPTVTAVNTLGTGTYLYTATYYTDDKARVSKIVKQHQLGGLDVTSNTYNFAGEITATTRQHYKGGSLALTLSNTYQYDHAGRKTQTTETINSQGPVTTTYTYNAVGQLQARTTGGQTTSYKYNPRGWIKEQSSGLFTQQLKYDDATGSYAQYNGNIGQQLWTTNGQSHSYNYSYDKASRLTSGISDENYNETGILYDKMGNIQSLTRQGPTGMPGLGTLSYAYNGNRLQSVSGGYNKSYSYNSNGSMTGDGTLNIQYNELNLPKQVSGTPVGTVSYSYDAAGGKLSKQTVSETRQYVDGIEYIGTTIDLLHTEAGVARNNGGTYTYEFFLKDHLGNTRVVVDQAGTVLQQTDYYPFGLPIETYTAVPNNYLYQGKELQRELTQFDFGARFYDPQIGRWHVLDPLSEKARRHSPYNFAFNNPIRFIDPDGMEADDWVKRGNRWSYDPNITTRKQAIEAGADDFARNGTVLNNVKLGDNGEVGNVWLQSGGQASYVPDDFTTISATEPSSIPDNFVTRAIDKFYTLGATLMSGPMGYSKSDVTDLWGRSTTYSQREDAFVASAAWLVPGAPKAAGAATKGLVNITEEAALVGRFYEVNGSKFSTYYYNKLWSTGRGGASLVAKEVFEGGANTAVPAMTKKGFYDYNYGGWNMIYNPTTKEVWHIQPIK